MTKTQHTRFRTGVAVAALLAFGPAPALAQMTADPLAAPAPVLPPETPVVITPQVTPQIVLPEDVAPPAPTVQPIPEPSASASPQTARATPRAATATPVARSIATRAATPVPVAEPAPASGAPVENVSPIEAAPVAAPMAEPAPATFDDTSTLSDNSIAWALLLVLGVITVVGLAIWGFISIGRRKRPDEDLAVPTIERRVATTPVAPVAVAPLASAPLAEPVKPAPVAFVPDTTPLVAPTTKGGLPHAGASVALPRTAPESYEERAALMERMINAKPDRANPFIDRKARMKRARLIMQSLGRDFGETEPWIDLSQYPNNWPELARRKQAA